MALTKRLALEYKLAFTTPLAIETQEHKGDFKDW
jgi:hypothetical protein